MMLSLVSLNPGLFILRKQSGPQIRVCNKTKSFFSTKTYVVGTQKNRARLNGSFGHQKHMFWLRKEKIKTILGSKKLLNCPHEQCRSRLAGCRVYMGPGMRFPTIWYVRPAKAQTRLRIHAVWSEPLLVAWIFHKCSATDWTSFGASKPKRKLQRLVRVYTCQNVKLLKISCHGSYRFPV